MSNKILEAHHGELRFTIEEDLPEVGAYLYVFRGDKCIRDSLQNDIDTCKEVALEDFEVSLDKWHSGEE